ncbi:hypothetical protein F0562_017563 [Nyssa sinensis]|uniref:Uncharacterized protein n=1 Tax=Nyssa sinensis TaxID=561372 RepID=A0A5J4ZFH7_9ASTE|nr:hypothetical protein F0562_017563 [Nyssa sinensis]
MDPSISHPDGSSTYLVQRRRRRPIQPGPQIQDPYESAPVVVIQQLTRQEDLLYQWCMKKDDFLILSMMVIHILPSPTLMRSDIIDSMKTRGHVSFKVMDVACVRELFHHILTYCGGVVSVNEFEIMHHRLPQQAQRDPGSSGIFVIKFMEYWNGRMTSSFSKDTINLIRKQLVVQWVTHDKNLIKPTL